MKIPEEMKQTSGIDFAAAHLERIEDRVGFAGKRVLEVGGSNISREIALGLLSARQWISCDYVRGASGQGQLPRRRQYVRERLVRAEDTYLLEPSDFGDFAIIDGDFTTVSLKNDSIDLCISLSVLEHLSDILGVLISVRETLVSGGVFASVFGPIWSGHVGHHINDIHTDCGRYFNIPDHLPFGHWDHLLNNPTQIYELMRDNFSERTIAKVLHQTFFSERINRLWWDDYVFLFEQSGLEIVELSRDWVVDPPPEVLDRLKRAYPDRRDFSTSAAFVVLRKP